MTTLNITNTFTNGSLADADEMNQNFTDVETVVNGNIDYVNLGTNSSSIASGTVEIYGRD